MFTVDPDQMINYKFKYVKNKNPKYLVYGYYMPGILQQHKWIEINKHLHAMKMKNGKLTKELVKDHVCCEHQFTNKPIQDESEFWNNFEEISLEEYDKLFMKDYNQTYP